MPVIQLIRHGATALNHGDRSVDRIRGWKDIPLSKEGKQEAYDIAEKLEGDIPDILATSDLKRASDTADIISDDIGVPVSVRSESFRPWNVGDYAGQVTEKVLPILSKLACDEPDKKCPGGESFNDFKGRFFEGLYTLIEMHPGKDIAVVAHHRNERLLAAWEAEGYPEDGTIDKRVFTSKGNDTAAVCEFNVPLRKLGKVADEAA
jgi:broad specificity phosphatase PhoE